MMQYSIFWSLVRKSREGRNMFSDRALSMEKVDFHFIIQSTSYQRVSYSRCLKIQLKTVAIRVDKMMCSPDFVVLLV